MKRVGLHGGCRGKTHSMSYIAAWMCLLVAVASPAQVGPWPWPPQFYEYAGPTVAFPETSITFTVAAKAFQTNYPHFVSVSYELLSAPSNTSFRTNQQSSHLNWSTPSRSAIGTTNLFIVRATDYGTPPLSSTTTVSIVIIEVPTIQTISLSNGAPVLQFTNPLAGFSMLLGGYLVESSTNLATTNWSQRPFIYSSLPWITFTDTNPPTSQCFYRLRPSDWAWWYPDSAP